MTLARLLVILSLDSGAFRAGMLTAMNQIGLLQSRLGGMGAGQALSGLGRGLTMGLTLPLLVAAAAIGSLGSSLDAEMARVQSVIATADDNGFSRVTQWRDDVQQLGIDMGRSSTEVTGGLYEIVSAFNTLKDPMEFLRISSKAAVAGQSDIVTSTKNLALSMRAWYDNMDDMTTANLQNMADLMSATVRVGTVTESELGPAMAGLLPVMRLYGVGLKDGFAGIASLAGVSGSASMAATQLQRAILSIVAPNTALQSAMKATGVESLELILRQEGLIAAFQKVNEIATETGVPLNKLLGRVEGLKAIATLTGPQLKAFGDNMEALKNATGAVDLAFEGTTNGINKAGFQWAVAGQRLRVIGEDLYQSFAPVSLKVLEALDPLIGKLRDLADTIAGMETEKVTQLVYGLLGLAALGPTLSIVGNIIKLFSILRFAILGFGAMAATALAPVLTALLPFVPQIALIVGAVTLMALAWNSNFLGIRDRTAAFVAEWKQHTSAISDAWNNVKAAFSNAGGENSIAGWIGGILRSVDQLLGVLGGTLIESTLAAFGTSTAQALANVGAAWNNGMAAIKGYISAGWAGLVAIWNNGVATIKQQAQDVWNKIGAGAKAAFTLALTSVASFGAGIVSALMSAVTGVLAFGAAMRSAFASAINSAIASVRTFGSSIQAAFNSAITAARSAASSIVSAFARNWSSIGSSIASGIAGGIRAGIGAITSAAASAANAALSAAKSALGIKSPSTVMDRQVGYMIPAGVAGGIYRGMGLITSAMGSIYTATKMGAYNLSANVAGSMQMQTAPAMAGAGGGGINIEITNNFNGPVTDDQVEQVRSANTESISKALRARGLI